MTVKEFFESEQNLAIHCNTKEKAHKLCREFDKLGHKLSYLGDNWDVFESETCYDNNCMYDRIDYYKKLGYTILEFEEKEIELEEKNENN